MPTPAAATPTLVRPCIVWTLLRAGSAPLAAGLRQRAGLAPQPPQPPLLPGGPLAQVTLAWLRGRDAAALHAATAALCARGGVIVHAVDGVPWPVSAALRAASVAAGCNHVFWYPQAAAPRLAPLRAALGAAPQALAQAGEVRLQALWDALLADGALPLALPLESLCAVGPTDAVAALRPLLARLGLPAAAGDLAWVERIRAAQPPAAAQPATAQPAAPWPRFAPTSVWRALRCTARALPAGVLRADIDTWPETLGATDLIRLGGVVVTERDAPDARLVMLDAQGREQPPVAWRLPSPRMRQLHPQAANAAAARFFWRMAGPPERLQLAWVPAAGAAPLPLIDCVWQPATLSDVQGWLAAQAGAPAPLALAGLGRTLAGLRDADGWAEAHATWQALRARAAPFIDPPETAAHV